jgi:acetyl/propionyl-CoA carboxylase alpha subunit
MGISSVCVYSEADRDTCPVLDADEAFHLGPAPATESYLSIDRILAAAERHRRAGDPSRLRVFSENVEFARECARRGIVFIGPRVEQIEAFALEAYGACAGPAVRSSAAAGNGPAEGSGTRRWSGLSTCVIR